MKFELTRAAYLDLAGIDDWLVENFGPSFAAKTHRKLFAEFALLADFPHLGLLRPDVTAKAMHFFCSNPYWIVYETRAPLRIHRVFHAARDLARLELRGR